ncbi:M16 family metallopeptidase [Cesiribacter andamanensis]|uniref:Peptidase M16 inactive domain protein n=1 Tax=Cesiribacter andamanensis AMV16 TaxID=1279009 RepID=M7NTA8_9BACT|nr:pitrilysin family protein [Cesiribacter andamanensis]EMR01709.1 Peptidase M16 inactive domain protein [Cesiribacter andamanensis AMV16]
MRKTNLYILLLALFALAGSAQAQNFKLPPYQKVQLPNGLSLYLMEQREVPLISVSAVLPAGTIYEQNSPGLAGVTADALMFGAGNRSKQQIEEELDFVGASVSTWATKETARLQASFAKKDAALVLGIVRDLLVAPRFDAQEWEKMQSLRLVEYDQAKESPRSVIADYYNAFVWGDHPYSRSSAGTKASLQAITIQDIQNFYKRTYTPGGAALAIVGDFDARQMRKQIQALFKDWKGKGQPAQQLAQAPQPQEARVLLVNKPDASETTFYIGGPGVARNNPDWVAIQVVNTILGGRFTSWLNDELRVNSGLTYGARSNFDSYKQGGTFAISTFTNSESTEAAVDLALKTYQRLHQQGIDAATLESAKNYVKGQFPPRYETASSLASLLTDMYWYGFDESFINGFQQQVSALDVARANAIAKKYFPADKLQFVLVGKADALKDLSKKWGTVSQKEIKDDGF